MKNLKWLNLGCGEYQHEEWLNVDSYEPVQPDLLCNITQLPFDDNSIDRVYMGHILEHMDYETMAVEALMEVNRILRPGGEFVVVGPDYDAAIAKGFGQDVLDDIIGGMVGDPTSPLAHQWTATAKNTQELINKVFCNVQETSLETLQQNGWPVTSLIGWQCGFVCS